MAGLEWGGGRPDWLRGTHYALLLLQGGELGVGVGGERVGIF